MFNDAKLIDAEAAGLKYHLPPSGLLDGCGSLRMTCGGFRSKVSGS
jgi:hypothetical protein